MTLQTHRLLSDITCCEIVKGKGKGKGKVERMVGYTRRNFMVPLPRFASWDDFNAYLEEKCRRRQGDVLRGHSLTWAETIGQRLERVWLP